jgi:hypothetical protein
MPAALKPQALLQELEALPHDARMRRMVEVGRLAARDRAAAATLAALEQGGFYEHFLALQACHGTRDAAPALRLLAGPSRSLRGRAARLLALLGTDEQVSAALRAAVPPLRLRLLHHLRRRKRTAPVDVFLRELAGRDDPDLDLLLPFASERTVARLLDRARERGGRTFWSRLARYHPALAARALADEAAATDGPDFRLTRVAAVALPFVSERRPDDALAAVKALAQRLPPAQLPLAVLARRRPAAVADLVLKSPAASAFHFALPAHRLDARRRLALLQRRPRALSPADNWLRRLPPDERASMFAAAAPGWRDADGCIAPALLAVLPAAVRVPEARRHLALPALATRPAQRLAYAALLPWDEARPVADPLLSQPDATLRAAALTALVGATRYDRARLGEMLALLLVRRNEQDPVRLALMTALADLPPGAWRAEHLDGLGQVVRHALDAVDLSYATASAAERLVVALLPFHPEWCVSWLVTLVKERGAVHLGDLGRRLTDADVRRIAPALEPLLRAWQAREREGHLLGLAEALGLRLRAFDALLDVLERIVEHSRAPGHSAWALTILARHRRGRLADLVPRLLGRDPSWITQEPVLAFVHRRRQDLLTPRFLGRQAYRGRFSTGRTRHVLPLKTGFFRWTAAQQATFAATLEEVADASDKLRDLPSVCFALDQLAALPAVEPRRLLEATRDPRPAVAARAVQAIGRLDGGQGVGLLIEALGDDRARLAVYALRRAFGAMPAAHALDLLRTAPAEKVTVAKEVVRLAGDVPSPDAFRFLQEIDARPLHRDVRVALLRALWTHLEEPAAWDVLDRAAESPDAALVSGLVRIPSDRLGPEARRRLAGLLAALLRHPEPAIRLGVLVRCTELPVDDPDGALLPRLLEMLPSALPDERTGAAFAVFSLCTPRDVRAVVRAVKLLLPDRRALGVAVGALRDLVNGDRPRLLPFVRAVLPALAADPLTVCLRVALAGQLPVGELAAFLVRIAPGLHADAVGRAEGALHQARLEAEELEKLEAALSGSADERLRRLALAALVAAAGGAGGWTDDRLERLRAFRADGAPLVAEAAAFTLPAEEVR